MAAVFDPLPISPGNALRPKYRLRSDDANGRLAAYTAPATVTAWVATTNTKGASALASVAVALARIGTTDVYSGVLTGANIDAILAAAATALGRALVEGDALYLHATDGIGFYVTQPLAYAPARLPDGA